MIRSQILLHEWQIEPVEALARMYSMKKSEIVRVAVSLLLAAEGRNYKTIKKFANGLHNKESITNLEFEARKAAEKLM